MKNDEQQQKKNDFYNRLDNSCKRSFCCDRRTSLLDDGTIRERCQGVVGGGTDLRCREVCRRMRIEIDSMVDKIYEGFKALFLL